VRCMSRAGARVARSADDVRFFFDAQSRGYAQHPGTVFTNHWTVAVQRWENVPGPPTSVPGWKLWAAEPFHSGQALTVKKLVADWPRGSYVAFVSPSHPRTVHAVERCFAPVYGRRGTPLVR
jgi:hypothetical protein